VTEEQIIAANVDAALIVTGLDGDYNLKRIERYMTLVLDFGIDPMLVLNKTDLCSDAAERIEDVESIAVGFPVIAISADRGSGMEELAGLLTVGKTYVLLGSSGVGKSTIVNALMGRKAQRIRAVRENDSRGRHTTTARELFVLECGAMLIDNPGMRELQLWGDDRGLGETFGDVASLASGCRFADCTHTHEPGCAVLEAVQRGTLEPQRLESYLKLQRELDYLQRKVSERADRNEKARWKSISKQIKKFYEHRRGG
jgi:ribosome biogenesis GTPase